MDPVDLNNRNLLHDQIIAGNCSVDFCRKFLTGAVGVDHGDLLITAAEFSRRGENHQIVQLLIDEFGADVHFRDDEDGWTALVHAVYYSGRFSTDKTVRILIDAGSEINFQDGEGTALMRSVFLVDIYSTKETVRMLIDAGTDVNLKSDWYYGSALGCGVRMCKTICATLIVNMLIEAI